MKITNLSAEPLGRLHSWIPHDLQAEQIVFLPDACPGKSPLPTGTAVLTRQEDWRRFAISDCGCGMRLVRSSVPVKDFDNTRWNAVADHLRANKGGLGDLGGGNHFLDALAPYADGPLIPHKRKRCCARLPLMPLILILVVLLLLFGGGGYYMGPGVGYYGGGGLSLVLLLVILYLLFGRGRRL